MKLPFRMPFQQPEQPQEGMAPVTKTDGPLASVSTDAGGETTVSALPAICPPTPEAASSASTGDDSASIISENAAPAGDANGRVL
jgi:hypothetical protein